MPTHQPLHCYKHLNILRYCIIAVAASKSGTYQMLCTVLELLMTGRETARNMQSIDSNKEYCITLHLLGCT